MIGISHNDICFSTARNGHNPFNTDGKERTTLAPELARTAFDFRIVKSQNYDDTGRAIPGQYHLEREGSREIVPSASVGSGFTPVQHLDVFDYIIHDIMPQVPEMELEMAGTIHGGGTSLIAAKFGQTFALPGDESPNETRLFFRNPSNGTGSMTLGFTTVRVVCQNTLMAATEQAKGDGWKIKHTKSAPAMAYDAVKTIRGQAIAALDIKERSRRLAEIGVDGATVRQCLDAIYPAESLPEGPGRTRMLNLRTEVMRQFECGETAETIKTTSAWRLFNSFTYPIFNPAKLRQNEDLAQVQYKAMAGDRAVKVRGMFEKVYAIAAA